MWLGPSTVVCVERVRDRQERDAADSSEDKDVRTRLRETDLTTLTLLTDAEGVPGPR